MAELPQSRINERNITSEMRESFLDYAMSVIVARALPDVRDGFKTSTSSYTIWIK